MTKKQILALFMALAAFFAGFLTHSIVGAVAAAALAALMFYCRFLPMDDSSQPTPAQQNIGLAIALSALAVWVLGTLFHWAEWWLDVFSGASTGYFGMIMIMNVLYSWKKK